MQYRNASHVSVQSAVVVMVDGSEGKNGDYAVFCSAGRTHPPHTASIVFRHFRPHAVCVFGRLKAAGHGRMGKTGTESVTFINGFIKRNQIYKISCIISSPDAGVWILFIDYILLYDIRLFSAAERLIVKCTAKHACFPGDISPQIVIAFTV